jgi:hypothetical protein
MRTGSGYEVFSAVSIKSATKREEIRESSTFGRAPFPNKPEDDKLHRKTKNAVTPKKWYL